MNPIIKIFFLMAVFSLVAGCNKTDEFTEDGTIELKKARVEVTVPFEADLIG